MRNDRGEPGQERRNLPSILFSPFASAVRRLHLFVIRDRATRELEEEMRLHRELRMAVLPGPDAASAARRHFGNPVQHVEASRDAWGWRRVDDMRQDLRYAARRLRQRPGFSLSVIIVLSLGIGATTAMFSAVDAAMLRPLPFPHPERLVTLSDVVVPFDPGSGQHSPEPSYHMLDLGDVARMRDQFSSLAVWAAGGLNLANAERPVRLRVGVVSQGFFGTLGVAPLLGRTFVPVEGTGDGANVAVLSYSLWQAQFGGRDMLNRTVRLNDKAYVVVGVMPRGFSFPDQSDLWIPMAVPNTLATFGPFRGFVRTTVLARLEPGVTIAGASSQAMAHWRHGLGAAAHDSTRRYPAEVLEDVQAHGAVIPLQQGLVGDRHTALIILLGATGLLLLIACANVTNLLLSQSVARRREIAVREILGATRGRVLRQLLTESLLLALGGSVLGVAFAPLLLRLLEPLLPAELAGLAPARLDVRVLGFAIVLGLATGVAFGLWPALRTGGRQLGAAIKSSGGRGGTAGRAGRTRRGLVAAELALTVILLIGAGLMLRSFSRLMGVDRGLNVEHVGTLEMSFVANNDSSGLGRLARMHEMMARLQATPGITASGIVNDLPLSGAGGISIGVTVPGALPLKPGDQPFARYLVASGSYFRAFAIPLLAGRTVTAADDAHSGDVAVINQTMAKQFWPDGTALGRTFETQMQGSRPITVVGIAADVRESGLGQDPGPQMYLSLDANPPLNIALIARGNLTPTAMLNAMRGAVRAVDPSQAIFHLRMMDDVVSSSVAPRRTNTLLISLFAALALVLASFGIYAVVSQSVAQRVREFGIRSALGATSGDLLRLVGREMVGVTGIGMVAGLVGAWALTRFASSLLFDITVHDPATFIAVPLVLLVPAILATLIPARRAARVNPADAMRVE